MANLFTLGLEESVDSIGLEMEDLYQRVGHNTGNLAFHYAINSLLNLRPVSIPWSADSELINSTGHLGIIPCANQIGSHADMSELGKTLSNVNSNMVAIGLGAQASINLEVPAVPQGTIGWLNEIVRLAPSKHPNVAVRGDFTLEVLNSYGFEGKAVSLGCPSLFISRDRSIGSKIQERFKNPFKRACIAGGHPDWEHLKAIEISMVDLMNKTDGSYVVQATQEALALARGEFEGNETYLSRLARYFDFDLDAEQMTRWVNKYFMAFYNIPSWIEYLKKFDVVVGPRIHGVMLAIQAGVPAVCIAHDSRTRELCEKSCIPWLSADEVSGGINLDILQNVKFDGDLFDRNRAFLFEEYKKFFSQNKIKF